VLAIAAGFPDLAIARPALASGARVVKICAQCHAPLNRPIDRNDPASVRFQGATLTWSRCYAESNDRLDCVTCHDPHRNADTSPAHYEAKCLTCHPAGGSSPSPAPTPSAARRRSKRFDLAAAPHASSCPVNPRSGCIACHMPTVRDAVAHSPFTDHFIRVHPEKAADVGAMNRTDLARGHAPSEEK
jgi:formate-dependent nitrite reductase cytochrome c552 subunit